MIKNNLLKSVASLAILGFAYVGSSAHAATIATESFKTTGSSTDYTNNTAFNTVSNANIVDGNTGFSATQTWTNGTSLVLPRNNLPGLPNLTHNALNTLALQQSMSDDGLLFMTTGSSVAPRNSNREIGSPLPGSSSYFLSGLVRTTSTLDDGDRLAMGMSSSLAANTFSVADGFHLGILGSVSGNRLAAFAGNSTFDLGITMAASTVYQIVLRLDVNDTGNDTLTAWYAADSATSLTLGLTATTVETFQGASDLSYFVAQEVGVGANNFNSVLDEMRFGTAMADVTAIPEPSTVLLLLGGLAGIVARRCHKRK